MTNAIASPHRLQQPVLPGQTKNNVQLTWAGRFREMACLDDGSAHRGLLCLLASPFRPVININFPSPMMYCRIQHSKGKQEGGWMVERVWPASAVCMQKSWQGAAGGAANGFYDLPRSRLRRAMVSEDDILMQLEGRKCQIKWRPLARKSSLECTTRP